MKHDKNLIFSFFLIVSISLAITAAATVVMVYAAPLGETEQCTLTTSGSTCTINVPGVNATTGVSGKVVLRETGTSCSTDAQCQSGYCCSSICSASACTTTTTTTSTSGGGTTVGGGGAGTTTITPAAPTPTPPVQVPVTPVSVPVTDTSVIQEIITAITPQQLGVTEIDAGKIEVVKTGVAEAAVTATPSIIDAVLPVATEQAKDVLQEIKNEISSGGATGVQVSATLEVFEVKSKETGKTTFVSKISLEFKAAKDEKNVKIVEVIPKSVAASIAEVIFIGEQPTVLQADPIVQWQFSEVKQGETKDLSYTINKKLDTLNTTTIAVAQAAAVPAKPLDMTIVYIIVAILVVVLVVWKLGLLKMPAKPLQKRDWRR